MLPAPAIWSPAKAQARQETLLIVSESGPNNIDIHGVGTNVPGYEVSWNCYDRLISHEMKTGRTARPITTSDKFKPELADDMNVGDMSVTFKLKKNATFQDGTPVTAKDVKWSLDRAVTVGGFPTFQMGAGSLTKPEQFVVVDDHTVRVDFLRKDRLTIPDLAVIVPCDHQFRAGEEARDREGPVGARIHQAEHRRQRRLQGRELDRRHRSRSSSATTNGPAGRCRRSGASSGAWCRRPATGARCSSAATPTSPTTCRTRISSSCKDAGKLNIVSTPYSNGIQYLGMNVTKPPFDNLEGAPGRRLRHPLPEDHGRGAVRPRQADVRRAGRHADRSRLAAAAQVQHRHRQGQAAAGRGRLSERLRDHALVRPRLCRRQRAALRADRRRASRRSASSPRSTRSPARTGAPS